MEIEKTLKYCMGRNYMMIIFVRNNDFVKALNNNTLNFTYPEVIPFPIRSFCKRHNLPK